MTTPPSRLLTDLTTEEARDLIGPESVVVLPIGAIEQHGPHLPLSTDAILTDAATNALRDEPPAGVDVFFLPSLCYATSAEHRFSAGTMSLSEPTLLAVIADLADSVAALKARRFVILNGHGGNTALLRVASRQVRLKHRFLTFLMHPVLSADHGGPTGESAERGLGCHANQGETSIMLHLRPDLVRMERAVANVPDWLSEYDDIGLGGSVTFGWSAGDFGPSGVIGDPTAADPVLGAKLWDYALDRLRAGLTEIGRFEFPNSVLGVR